MPTIRCVQRLSVTVAIVSGSLLGCVAIARSQEAPPTQDAADAGTPQQAPAEAEAPLTEAHPHTDTIEVRALRGVRAAPEVTTHSIELREVLSVPGTGGDVVRAIETLPGVARPPALDGLLIVRGSAPDDSHVFVDGTDVPFAYHFGGATSIVPGDVIDHLDFYPGNFGPAFGRAMGGVVEIGLRSPRSDRLGALLQLDVVDGRMLIETPLGEDTRLLIAGRRSWVDAWLGSVLEDASTSVQTAPAYWDWQAVLEHDFSQHTRARLAIFGGDDRFALLIKSPSAGDPLGGELALSTTFNRLQLRLQSALSERVEYDAMLSWGVTGIAQSFGGYPVDFTIHGLQARSELRYRLANWATFSAGLDAQWSHFDVSATFFPYPSANQAPGPYFARPKRQLDETVAFARPALYSQLELRLGRLTLLPSVRADYSSDTERTTIDPRLGARFKLLAGERATTLKGGIGIMHQPPLPQESVQPVGSPGVESNAALHASVGLEQRLSDALELSVEGFYKRLWDLVIARPDEATALGARFDNTGSGRVYGVEALLRLQPSGALNGWIAYTISRSQRRDAPSGPLYTFQYDQSHILSAVANLQLGWGMTLGARFRLVSGTPYTPYVGAIADLDAGAYVPLRSSQPNSARLPAFHQLDLRIEKLWDFAAWKLTLYLELRNAYNRENAEAMTYNYDYSQSKPAASLPLLPVLGLRGEL
jgi:hypothetical protein